MSWTVLLLAAALALITLRIYFKLRLAHKSRAESWDEQVIGRLRSQGYAPFNDTAWTFFSRCRARRPSREHVRGSSPSSAWT